MKFYIFQKESFLYKKFNFFKPKGLFYFLLVQIIISFIFIMLLSLFYKTPKERKLENNIKYLITEYNLINNKINESDMLLNKIILNDSIIYKSIFDVTDKSRKQMDAFYDIDSNNINYYNEIVKKTNVNISSLNSKLSKELYSLDNLLNIAYLKQDMLLHIPAIQPIYNKDLKRTASGWGYRIHPIYKIKKFHYGMDFTAKIGTNVYATGDGIIEYIISYNDKLSKGYGNFIIINHEYGYKTLYAHLSKFKVKKGQLVKRGEIIANVGNTGLSTGPHLHYEIIKNGIKVNPIYYYFNDLTPNEYQKIIQISTSINKSYD
jgi:murein DD-endopeptidase MepM/ murein hydrolase activator NlpD